MNDEIKTKRKIFSLVSDVDVQESMIVFSAKLKNRYQRFLNLLSFVNSILIFVKL